MTLDEPLPPSEPIDEEGSGIMIVIIAAVVGVVLVGLVIYCCVRKMKANQVKLELENQTKLEMSARSVDLSVDQDAVYKP